MTKLTEITRLISAILFESQELWTATNIDVDFKSLPDNVIAVNGDDEDETFYIVVHEISKEDIEIVDRQEEFKKRSKK